jgi:hypothetical protein
MRGPLAGKKIAILAAGMAGEAELARPRQAPAPR